MVQVDEAQKGKQKEIKEKLFEESDERADLIGKSIRTVRLLCARHTSPALRQKRALSK